MIIESAHTHLDASTAQPEPVAPMVALLGAAARESPVIASLRRSGASVVPLVVNGSAEGDASALMAALSCDLVVVELPAAVGLDEHTPRLWEQLGYSGIPRVVVVSGLEAGRADFDDLAAIAQRVLGEDAIPVRLPVFDSGEQPVASLDLRRAVLDTLDGSVPAESGHLTVAAGDMSALLSVVAATVADDAAAAHYMEMLERLSEDDVGPTGEAFEGAGTGDRAHANSVHLGMPRPHSAGPDVPQRLSDDVADAVAEGLLSPILVDTPEGAWLRDLHDWSIRGGSPSDRLVRRNADGEPAEGWAGMVLAVDGEAALIRPVFGTVEAGYALITAVGSDEAGTPVPHRAWPTDLRPLDTIPEDLESPRPQWWATTVRMSVGDTVSGGHVWLIPAE